MQFTRLSDLTSLLAQPEVEHIDEAKSASSDFEGISSVVNDALDDLSDKIEALMDLAKETGATKLDTVKDKDGMTVFKKLDKCTKDYVKEMKRLMSEAEVMVMQVAESEEADAK